MRDNVILSLQQVCLNYGPFQALQCVSFDMMQGTRTALIGSNGAGKSSLFDVISGFYQPQYGDIYLSGTRITSASKQKRYQLGLVRSFQQSRLFAEMTVLENLQCAAFVRYTGFWQKYAFWRALSRFSRVQAAVQEVLQQMGLSSKAYEKASALSYAEQRQLELGMVLATGATVLLLDEPTAGLSHEQTDKFLGYMEQALQGKTILLVEHDLSVVQRLTERAIVLEQGQVLAHGLLEDVVKDPQVQAAYPGIVHAVTPTSVAKELCTAC